MRDPLPTLKKALRDQNRDEFLRILYDHYAEMVLSIIEDNFPLYERTFEPTDILANVFLRLSRYGLKPYSEGSLDSIRNYIYTTTLNCLRSHIRKSKRNIHAPLTETLPQGDHFYHDNGIDHFEYFDQLQDLVKVLTDTQKKVFRLKLQGYSHQEIAELLGIREANSRQHLRKAVLRLRRELESGKLC